MDLDLDLIKVSQTLSLLQKELVNTSYTYERDKYKHATQVCTSTAPYIVPTSNFRSIEVRRYLDVRVARSTSVLFEVSMSNLPPRVSHQERCCLVMRTTVLWDYLDYVAIYLD